MACFLVVNHVITSLLLIAQSLQLNQNKSNQIIFKIKFDQIRRCSNKFLFTQICRISVQPGSDLTGRQPDKNTLAYCFLILVLQAIENHHIFLASAQKKIIINNAIMSIRQGMSIIHFIKLWIDNLKFKITQLQPLLSGQ